jgi:O-antigen/teichoic acid export membrane protein
VTARSVPNGVEDVEGATSENPTGQRRGASVLQDRLVRTAWPLVVNTVSNGALGVAYWVVAARLYPQHSVATNLALISAMTTLSGICQLNLGPGLAVFVPRAGRHARRVVLQAYAAVTVFAGFALVIFATIVLPHLKLAQVLNSPSRLMLFGAAVVAFNLFALQDAALVSLRYGKWIPLENAIFGVTKIGLLFAFMSALPATGIFTSWFVPMLILIPVVSVFIFGRPHRASEAASLGSVRESLPQLVLDYIGYLFQISSTVVMPVLALELLPVSEASVFAIAWLTSSTLDLLATNVGTALTVETTYGEDPKSLRRSVFRRALPMVAAASTLGLITAPLILRLYGSHYSLGGTATLQILLLASVPRALVTFTIAEARAHREIGFIVRLRAQNTLVTLSGAALLAPRYGAVGMALGWLIAQLLGAGVALRHVIRTHSYRTSVR